MTASKEAVLIKQILAKHGAHPDLRLFRNETALTWAGKMVPAEQARRWGVPPGIVCLRHATRLQAGLCKGSADLIGIGPGGLFWGIEVKTPGVRVADDQDRFLGVIRQLGGIGEVIRTVDEVGALLEKARGE